MNQPPCMQLTRPWPALLALLFFALLCLTLSPGLYAQAGTGQVTDQGAEKLDEKAQELSKEELTQSADSVWADPIFYQYEKMMPRLASSMGRLNARISTLAVVSMTFSSDLAPTFQKVASAKFYGQLLLENPKLKLIKCDECTMLRSEIKDGVLVITKGLGDKDQRQALAKKLGVEAFLTADIIEDDRQLSIIIKVADADEGRIILSDVIVGVPVPKTTYYNYYGGTLQLPVKLASGTSLTESAILLGAEKSIRFAESWMLAANLALYTDNNSKLEEDHITFSSGLMFDGTVGWEALNLMNNNASFALMLGLGEFFSTQFSFAVYQKVGLKITIGQLLTFNIYSLSFDATNLETPVDGVAPQLTGSGSVMAFGFQF